jgi:hypothetical protein
LARLVVEYRYGRLPKQDPLTKIGNVTANCVNIWKIVGVGLVLRYRLGVAAIPVVKKDVILCKQCVAKLQFDLWQASVRLYLDSFVCHLKSSPRDLDFSLDASVSCYVKGRLFLAFETSSIYNVNKNLAEFRELSGVYVLE